MRRLSISPGNAGFRAFVTACVLVFWFALGLQFKLTLDLAQSRGLGVERAVWIYLAYFTILSNLIAAVALSAPLLAPRSAGGRFFERPGPLGAITVYMLLVGIAYNLLLRGVWNPQGWQLVADNLLHCVDPLLLLGYWWLAGRSATLSYRAIGRWAIYPVAYLAYAVARGLSGDAYAYPFIDVGQIGLARVLLNVFGIGLGFLAMAASLIALGRRSSP